MAAFDNWQLEFLQAWPQVSARRHGELFGLSDRRVNKEELILIRCRFCLSAVQI